MVPYKSVYQTLFRGFQLRRLNGLIEHLIRSTEFVLICLTVFNYSVSVRSVTAASDLVYCDAILDTVQDDRNNELR